MHDFMKVLNKHILISVVEARVDQEVKEAK